jgi:hypothetical protein
MLYIKSHFPAAQYEDQFAELWQAYWRDSMDISKPDVMKECLKRHFSDGDAKRIIEGGAYQSCAVLISMRRLLMSSTVDAQVRRRSTRRR